MEWLLYLLKVSLCTVPFYLAYWLGMRKLTFFAWNRAYLLLALVVSWIIPLVQIELPVAMVETISPQRIMPLGIWASEIQALPEIAPVVHQADSSTVENILVSIYLLGAIWMFSRLGYSLWSIYRRIKQFPAQYCEGYWVIHLSGNHAHASFFNIIFLNQRNTNADEQELILAHEKWHAYYRHSIDVIVVECMKGLLWFNPLMHLFQRSLQLVHEFEVDAQFTCRDMQKSYAHLLLKLHEQAGLPLLHSFSQSPLSQRIQMLFHPKSTTMYKSTYFLFVPLLLVTMFFLSCDRETASLTSEPGEVLLLVNGQEHRYAHLSRLKLAEISNIELYKPEAALDRFGKKAKKGAIVIKSGFDELPEDISIKALLTKDDFFQCQTIDIDDGTKVYQAKFHENTVVQGWVGSIISPSESFLIGNDEFNITHARSLNSQFLHTFFYTNAFQSNKTQEAE